MNYSGTNALGMQETEDVRSTLSRKLAHLHVLARNIWSNISYFEAYMHTGNVLVDVQQGAAMTMKRHKDDASKY